MKGAWEGPSNTAVTPKGRNVRGGQAPTRKFPHHGGGIDAEMVENHSEHGPPIRRVYTSLLLQEHTGLAQTHA